MKNSDNWETPKELYDKLNEEFNFDFDPCPLRYEAITPDVDGLLIEWGERNFINPPSSSGLKEAFVEKALSESKKGKLCVLLLPVSTSTKLFHNVIQPNATEIRFLSSRIKFKGYNTKGEFVSDKFGTHDSMVVIFNPYTPVSPTAPKGSTNDTLKAALIAFFSGLTRTIRPKRTI